MRQFLMVVVLILIPLSVWLPWYDWKRETSYDSRTPTTQEAGNLIRFIPNGDCFNAGCMTIIVGISEQDYATANDVGGLARFLALIVAVTSGWSLRSAKTVSGCLLSLPIAVCVLCILLQYLGNWLDPEYITLTDGWRLAGINWRGPVVLALAFCLNLIRWLI
jgi:hypothetical protein